jgi:hypothetical protein
MPSWTNNSNDIPSGRSNAVIALKIKKFLFTAAPWLAYYIVPQVVWTEKFPTFVLIHKYLHHHPKLTFAYLLGILELLPSLSLGIPVDLFKNDDFFIFSISYCWIFLSFNKHFLSCKGRVIQISSGICANLHTIEVLDNLSIPFWFIATSNLTFSS